MSKAKELKEGYEEAYIEDFGDYEIVSVDKKDLDWLIKQAEKIERYEKALKAYGDEEGKLILKDLEESERFVEKFNKGEIS